VIGKGGRDEAIEGSGTWHSATHRDALTFWSDCLKFEAARGPVEVLVIDSVQRPLEN